MLASDCDRPNRWWSNDGAGCALQNGNRPNYMYNSYWYNELKPMELKPLIQTQALLYAPLHECRRSLITQFRLALDDAPQHAPC